jgi:hypothetical protein
MKYSLNGLEIRIIWKLHRKHDYNKKHTSIDNLKRGFPRDSGKDIARAIDSLIQQGILLVQKKTKEDHVVLNIKKICLIKAVTDWFKSNMDKINKNELAQVRFEFEC